MKVDFVCALYSFSSFFFRYGRENLNLTTGRNRRDIFQKVFLKMPYVAVYLCFKATSFVVTGLPLMLLHILQKQTHLLQPKRVFRLFGFCRVNAESDSK